MPPSAMKFVAVVAKGRKDAGLTTAEVQKLADGRVYTAEEARRAKLVDEIGYFNDAIRATNRRAGLKDAKVISVGAGAKFRPGFADNQRLAGWFSEFF